MMDRLIKFRTVHDNGDVEYTLDVGTIKVNQHGDGLIRQVLDKLYRLETVASDKQVVASEWISVNERLPEQCGMGCLLCAINKYGQRKVFEGFTGYMEGGKFRWHTNLKDISLDVWDITHWMPLPEPPKEG